MFSDRCDRCFDVFPLEFTLLKMLYEIGQEAGRVLSQLVLLLEDFVIGQIAKHSDPLFFQQRVGHFLRQSWRQGHPSEGGGRWRQIPVYLRRSGREENIGHVLEGGRVWYDDGGWGW